MENHINISGVDINYAETGQSDGVPVVVLHGWGCNLTTVRSIAQALEDKMRVICVDLPGHGKSGEPPEVWGSFDFAEFLKNFIEALKLERPSLIGHSFGGRTSIAYASVNKNVDKIILVDAAGITPRRSLKYYWKVYSYKTLKKLAFSLLGEKRGKELMERRLAKSGSADYQAASPKMRAIMSKCINEDLRKRMGDILAPVLLIWGENDTATPLSDARIMEKNIPDCGLVAFPNCGHYSFLENPWQFKAVVRSFLINEK